MNSFEIDHLNRRLTHRFPTRFLRPVRKLRNDKCRRQLLEEATRLGHEPTFRFSLAVHSAMNVASLVHTLEILLPNPWLGELPIYTADLFARNYSIINASHCALRVQGGTEIEKLLDKFWKRFSRIFIYSYFSK